MIKSYITPDHRTWADEIAGKVWCFNISIHESTGYSPFYLCNGRHHISPSLRRSQERNAAAEWDQKVDNLKFIRQTAGDNQREATEMQAKYYNVNRARHNFKVGDIVLVKNTVLSNAAEHTVTGLTLEWRGEYKIVAKVSNNIFALSDLNDSLLGNFHAKDMRSRVERVNENPPEKQSETHTHYHDPSLHMQTLMHKIEEAFTHNLSQDKTHEEKDLNITTSDLLLIPETITKRKRGRPKKKKVGRPRKTIVAPQPEPRNTSKNIQSKVISSNIEQQKHREESLIRKGNINSEPAQSRLTRSKTKTNR